MELKDIDWDIMEELEKTTSKIINMYAGTFRILADKEEMKKRYFYQGGLMNYLKLVNYLGIDLETLNNIKIDDEFLSDLSRFFKTQVEYQRKKYGKSML